MLVLEKSAGYKRIIEKDVKKGKKEGLKEGKLEIAKKNVSNRLYTI